MMWQNATMWQLRVASTEQYREPCSVPLRFTLVPSSHRLPNNNAFIMAHAFFLGVDVAGEASDAPGSVTATLLEKTDTADADAPHYRLDSIAHHDAPADPAALADHFQTLVADAPYTGRTTIGVNVNADAGQSLYDELEDRGLAPLSVTLTGGMGAAAASTDTMGVHLTEHNAVERLADAYRAGRLHLDGQASEDVSQLARGIQSFVAAYTNTDEATEVPDDIDAEPQRLGDFDTHVASAALALWIGEERSFDPSKHLKEEPRTDTPSVGDAL